MMASIESHSISGSIQLSTPAARGESSKLSTWTYTHTLQRAGRRRSILPRRSWWWNLKYRSTVVVSFPSILSSFASCISFVCQPFYFLFFRDINKFLFCCFVLFVCLCRSVQLSLIGCTFWPSLLHGNSADIVLVTCILYPIWSILVTFVNIASNCVNIIKGRRETGFLISFQPPHGSRWELLPAAISSEYSSLCPPNHQTSS